MVDPGIAAGNGNLLCNVYRIPGNVYFEMQKGAEKP